MNKASLVTTTNLMAEDANGNKIVSVDNADHTLFFGDKVDGSIGINSTGFVRWNSTNKEWDKWITADTGGLTFVQLADGKIATDTIDTYPLGVSTGMVLPSDGWPTGGTILTIQHNVNRYFQFFAGKDNIGHVLIRHNYGATGWSNWFDMSQSMPLPPQDGQAYVAVNNTWVLLSNYVTIT